MEVGLALAQANLCYMGTELPLPRGGRTPQFSAHVYCGQTAGWIKIAPEVGLGPGYIVLMRTQLPSPKRGQSPSNFRPISIVAKRLDASRCHLV